MSKEEERERGRRDGMRRTHHRSWARAGEESSEGDAARESRAERSAMRMEAAASLVSTPTPGKERLALEREG